mmetsp:Transcript_21498/g.48491  ORF Transcript_21498/g.48491 Transcript_21498/m.48491 type:complete len:301 (+) Transcript_21498:127-1029(+)
MFFGTQSAPTEDSSKQGRVHGRGPRWPCGVPSYLLHTRPRQVLRGLCRSLFGLVGSSCHVAAPRRTARLRLGLLGGAGHIPGFGHQAALAGLRGRVHHRLNPRQMLHRYKCIVLSEQRNPHTAAKLTQLHRPVQSVADHDRPSPTQLHQHRRLPRVSPRIPHCRAPKRRFTLGNGHGGLQPRPREQLRRVPLLVLELYRGAGASGHQQRARTPGLRRRGVVGHGGQRSPRGIGNTRSSLRAVCAAQGFGTHLREGDAPTSFQRCGILTGLSLLKGFFLRNGPQVKGRGDMGLGHGLHLLT